MAVNDEVRRLARKWTGGTGWPKRLEWLEIRNIRGWSGARLAFQFPIVAIVGENGSGKSTLLQAAACAYRVEDLNLTYFPSEFFPDTAWDAIREASITYGYSIRGAYSGGSLRKLTTRWLGHGERPVREIQYLDLNRLQPVGGRVGYARIAKTRHEEASAKAFDEEQVTRLSSIMGRNYDSARMALTSIDELREVPVISQGGNEYSGFHQGGGETVAQELLKIHLPRNGLVCIDELESSLHPRAQRRLIRDLAEQCRIREFQLIITTHSPYILDELPPEARLHIFQEQGVRQIIAGVSPQFSMTKMDDDIYPECDLYVEDEAAKTMLAEILAQHAKELFIRCSIIPFGTANVGYALGQMVSHNRFPRPSRVFLDGDNAEGPGCVLLPGNDAPEQVIFKILKKQRWGDLWMRIARDVSVVDDACTSAMTLGDHHDWVRVAANQLMCGRETLWHAMCAEWAKGLRPEDTAQIIQQIDEALT